MAGDKKKGIKDIQSYSKLTFQTDVLGKHVLCAIHVSGTQNRGPHLISSGQAAMWSPQNDPNAMWTTHSLDHTEVITSNATW